MKPIRFPDYDHSIVNVAASILHHYGAPTAKATLPALDAALLAGPRNVVLILVDALGDAMLSRHLGDGSVLGSHRIDTLTSVFPPTTVAATTAVLAGKTPLETGWVGWAQWFAAEGRTVITFTDTDFYDDQKIGHPVANAVLPYATLYAQIAAVAPDVATTEIFPAFRTPANDTFAKLTDAIVGACEQPGRHFVYAYWDKVDTLAHEFGPGSIEVNAMLRGIDAAYAKLLARLKDAVVILIADHGQVDVCPIVLDDHPDLLALCEHLPSIETRAAAFFVKEGKKEAFRALFNARFREYFNLYEPEELVRAGVFGSGTRQPAFDSFLGTFLAVAIDHYFFAFRRFKSYFRGQHAGLLAEEMTVPLCLASIPGK